MWIWHKQLNFRISNRILFRYVAKKCWHCICYLRSRFLSSNANTLTWTGCFTVFFPMAISGIALPNQRMSERGWKPWNFHWLAGELLAQKGDIFNSVEHWSGQKKFSNSFACACRSWWRDDIELNMQHNWSWSIQDRPPNGQQPNHNQSLKGDTQHSHTLYYVSKSR